MELASFTTAKLKEALAIRQKIDVLEVEIHRVMNNGRRGAPWIKRRRVMSPEGRERIAAAQRKRWKAFRNGKGK